LCFVASQHRYPIDPATHSLHQVQLTLGGQNIFVNAGAPTAPHVIRAAALAALCRFKLAANNDTDYQVCCYRSCVGDGRGREEARVVKKEDPTCCARIDLESVVSCRRVKRTCNFFSSISFTTHTRAQPPTHPHAHAHAHFYMHTHTRARTHARTHARSLSLAVG
jgi:hypothetical protein